MCTLIVYTDLPSHPSQVSLHVPNMKRRAGSAGSECGPREVKPSQASLSPTVPLKREYLLQLEAELNHSSSMTQPVGLGPQGLRTVLPPPSLTSVSTKRSRSSSPRKPSESAYRARTLFRAGIHVDVIVPRQIQSHINLALEQPPPAALATIGHLASKLQRESMDLTAAQAGEAEWTDLMHEILKELKSTDVMVARNRGIASYTKMRQVFGELTKYPSRVATRSQT